MRGESMYLKINKAIIIYKNPHTETNKALCSPDRIMCLAMAAEPALRA
jgi:hypothetical protein